MRQSLDLKLGQRLNLTPRLQQSIHLLQLSTLELEHEIQDALVSNPLLEENEDLEDSRFGEPLPDAGTGEDAQWDESERSRNEDPALAQDNLDALNRDADGFRHDSWEFVPERANPDRSTSGHPSEFDMLDHVSRGESLHDFLWTQVAVRPLSEVDRTIAQVIIGCIDIKGYLTASTSEIQDLLAMPDDSEVGAEEIEAVLHLIQSLEPAGVGARDLKECLRIQLRRLDPDTPFLRESLVVLDGQFNLLSQGKLTELLRQSNMDKSTLSSCLDLIRGLDPRPGYRVDNSTPTYLTPDVAVRRRADGWEVELVANHHLRLRINSKYKELMSDKRDREAHQYVKNHYDEARWFIRSLEQRSETMLKVATELVKRQSEFLERGPEALKPLTMREVAEAVGVHESTISRATAQKYVLTPQGVVEMKRFFSGHMGGGDTEGVSAAAIQEAIKKMVESEPPSDPVSDAKIADLLSARGMKVARRTVAKYREQLNIPSSSRRRSLL